MNLYLDIETIPAQRPDVLEEIRSTCKADLDAALACVKAPSNYKDADKIAEFCNAKRKELLDAHEAEVEAAYRKTGLDGAFGQVCVIGWAMDEREPQTLVDMQEGPLLRQFAEVLRAIPANEVFQTTVIGHNLAAFDLRFLSQRSIVNGIRPHPVIARAAQAKPWEQDKVFDTMVQWAGVGGKISLDKLCKALGIPTPKGDITGATVWDAVNAGRLGDVANYCAGDVRAVRAVHRRMTFAEQTNAALA